jgi:predicted RNase H-like HicB family nuclease
MRYAIVIEKAEIREAIEFHLEASREDGVPIPAPESKVDYVEVRA